MSVEGVANDMGRTRDPRVRGEGTMSPAIKLLGTVELRRSDGVVLDASALPTSKALDLLRLLIAADEERGRMSLRTALAQLRRVLGPEAVRRAGELVMVGDVDSDVAQLRRGAAAVERLRTLGQDVEVLRLVRDLEVSCGADLVVSS